MQYMGDHIISVAKTKNKDYKLTEMILYQFWRGDLNVWEKVIFVCKIIDT